MLACDCIDDGGTVGLLCWRGIQYSVVNFDGFVHSFVEDIDTTYFELDCEFMIALGHLEPDTSIACGQRSQEQCLQQTNISQIGVIRVTNKYRTYTQRCLISDYMLLRNSVVQHEDIVVLT